MSTRKRSFATIFTILLGSALALFACGGAPHSQPSSPTPPLPAAEIPMPPDPISPKDAAVIHVLSARLEWQSSPGADAYTLQVSIAPAFTSLIAERTGIEHPYYELTSGLNWNTSYYWRISASNATSTSRWSESRQFVTLVLQLDKIAFSSNRTGSWNIYMMNADGGNQTQITKGITGEFQTTLDDVSIAWSPDGTKIALDSRMRGKFDIYTTDRDGENALALTSNPEHDCFPAWSPSGRQIAFASSRDGNFEIYVMDSDGGNKTRLTDNEGADLFPCWSPDGGKIAFSSSRDGNDEIYVMDSDGSNQRRLTYNYAGDRFPSWSPDGTEIVFASNRDGNDEIYVMNSDGTEQTRLTSNTASDYTPKWSPDSTKIVFASNRDGKFQIYIMDADGENQTRITNNSADDRWPAWR